VHRASVLPVTLRSEVAVGLSDTAAATSGTIGWTDAIASELSVTFDLHIAVTPCWRHCTDTLLRWPSVHPVLKAWLLHAWHHLWNMVHRLHWCLWMDRRFNRCYTLSSVDLPLISRGAQTCTDDRASDLPTTIGCTDAHASVKPVPLFSAELVQCIAAISGFSLCFDISTADWTCHLDGGLDLASRR